jgi:hypothetical protein
MDYNKLYATGSGEIDGLSEWDQVEFAALVEQTSFCDLWTHLKVCDQGGCEMCEYLTLHEDRGYIEAGVLSNDASTIDDAAVLFPCQTCTLAFGLPQDSWYEFCSGCDKDYNAGAYGQLRWNCPSCQEEATHIRSKKRKRNNKTPTPSVCLCGKAIISNVGDS